MELAKEYRKKHGTQATVIVKDVASHGVPEEIFAELKEKGVVVDILSIMPASVCTGHSWRRSQSKEKMIDVNIKALTIMTKLFLPDMVKRGQGGVMNTVASTVAFFPGPMMSVYYATKAYVLSFTEALENELKGTGVTVTALCPGLTSTGFVDRSGMGASKLLQGGDIMEAGKWLTKRTEAFCVARHS